MLPGYFVYLAVLINIAGTASYIAATLRGQAKPNRISWAIWTLAPLTAFAAQISQGVGLEALLTFISGFSPFMVLLASFVNKKAYWKIAPLDWACGSLALAALILWALTREGLVAIILAIAADALAAAPTVLKSYRQPHSEHPLAFITAAISAIITLLTIQQWTLANASFSLYIAIICTLIATLILYPRRAKTSAKTGVTP
jgi:hypothetical protein